MKRFAPSNEKVVDTYNSNVGIFITLPTRCDINGNTIMDVCSRCGTFIYDYDRCVHCEARITHVNDQQIPITSSLNTEESCLEFAYNEHMVNNITESSCFAQCPYCIAETKIVRIKLNIYTGAKFVHTCIQCKNRVNIEVTEDKQIIASKLN